jgi:GR25 family glycosyltransferase involved in LPS biosynthesis
MDVIYWINLNSAIERKKHMKHVLTAFENIPKVRISATDGNTLKVRNKFILPLVPVTNNVNLRITNKEYACLLSHLETIRQFSKSDYNYALILEDDASLDVMKYWHTSFDNVIKNAPSDWEIIKLFSFENSNSTLYKKIEFPCFNKKTPKCSTSTMAYIINKKSAIKIIRELWNGEKYELPNILHIADYFLYMMLTSYDYKYPFFIPRKNNDSNVQLKYKQKNNNITRRKIINFLKSKKNNGLG